MFTRHRRLSFESLEERQMMAVFTVTNLNDAGVTAAGQAPGTLRQAVFDANATPGVADEIRFDAGLSGTIQLTHVASQVEGSSALVVSSPISIIGNTSGITIGRAAAAPEMRLFRVTGTGNLALEAINVTGGVARGDAGLAGSDGGDGRGGAVYNAGTLHIVASTLYNNAAIGGAPGDGGAAGYGLGGAIYNTDATLIVRNATLSGNQALNGFENSVSRAYGGGIYALNGSLAIFNSTLTDNGSLTGRGVYFIAVGKTADAVIHSTIIGQADTQVYDLFASFDTGGTVSVTGANNLIRRQNEFPEITVASTDPALNALANNGGPTLTHAVQGESDAIDNGSNVLNLTTDQRGSSFAREVGAGVDIGALESSTVAPLLPGDYNRDNFVNGADYVVWRKFLGNDVASYTFGDGDGSGDVDLDDFDVWEDNFGATSPATATAVALAANADAVPRRRPLRRCFETQLLGEHAHDRALLALLASWDGCVRGGREPIRFE